MTFQFIYLYKKLQSNKIKNEYYLVFFKTFSPYTHNFFSCTSTWKTNKPQSVDLIQLSVSFNNHFPFLYKYCWRAAQSRLSLQKFVYTGEGNFPSTTTQKRVRNLCTSSPNEIRSPLFARGVIFQTMTTTSSSVINVFLSTKLIDYRQLSNTDNNYSLTWKKQPLTNWSMPVVFQKCRFQSSQLNFHRVTAVELCVKVGRWFYPSFVVDCPSGVCKRANSCSLGLL